MIFLRIPLLLLLPVLPIIHCLQIPIPPDPEQAQSTTPPDHVETTTIKDDKIEDDLLHCQLELADKNLGLAALQAKATTLEKDLRQSERDLQTCRANLTQSTIDLAAADATLRTCRSQGTDCHLLAAEAQKCLDDAGKQQPGCTHNRGVAVRGATYLMLCVAVPHMAPVKTLRAPGFQDCMELCERNQPCVGVAYNYATRVCLTARFITVSKYSPDSETALAVRT
ncbi:hypothetical protein BJY00DRAFT_314545 [Aspergillus carlsbadensis]|nr:hypothetical protein BJY00DRAFT_314545 [Aspergillus carlsbadensis]